METYKADIIVLTWNRKQIIKNFVESFFANTALSSRLIIIDNGSQDGTGEYLATLKGTDTIKLKIVLNKENKGFVGGMNQGIALSDAPFVCLANNDLIFTRGWLEEVVSVFEKDARIGILNPNSNNLGTHPLSGMPLDDLAEELKKKYKGVFAEMPFCIGFCLFIRREVIEKVGGLSEEFSPFFFEDTDYSLKAQKAGYLIGVAKASYVWHKEHASFKQIGEKKEEFFIKSREAFRKKWGKILRIAWVVNSEEELSAALNDAVKSARSGNYLWFLVKNLNHNGAEIFQKLNLLEHSGIKFIRYSNILNLLWVILTKKKRYDLIISKDRLPGRLFQKFGYRVFDGFDESRINAVKKT